EAGVEVDEAGLLAAAAHAGERGEGLDEALHPLGAVDRELDVLVRALGELAPVAALEELGERGDLSQRLLEVVRGDVGELLEVPVRRLELEARLAHGVELGDETLAHPLDV